MREFFKKVFQNKKLFFSIIAIVLVIAIAGTTVGSCYCAKSGGSSGQFAVTFASEEDGVWVPEATKVAKGTEIYSFKNPQKDGCIFLGWYYDTEFTQLVPKDAVVDKDMTLYPRFTVQAGAENLGIHFDYVASQDVDADFRVYVEARDLSEEEVRELLQVSNLTKGDDVSYILSHVSTISQERPMLSDEEQFILEYMEEALELDEHKLAYKDAKGLKQFFGLAEDADLYEYLQEKEYPNDYINVFAKAFFFDEDAENPYESLSKYQISPSTGAWNAGNLHQVVIEDTERVRFIYEDETTEATVDKYNFTVHKDEIDNLELADDVIYVPASEIGGVDLSKGMFNVTTDENGEYLAERNNVKGDATYSGSQTFHKGDKLAVYEGTITADNRVDGKVVYITVTSDPNGGNFSYQSANYEEIVKRSDTIPVKDDGSIDDGKILISSSELNFNTAIHSELGLNDKTKVETGDFIIFYNGDLNNQDNLKLVGYGCITKVDAVAGGIQAEYNIVTVEDVENSMELYLEKGDMDLQITEEEMHEIESDLEVGAIESGYFQTLGEEVALLLTDETLDLSDSQFKDVVEQAKFTGENGQDMSLEEVRKLASGGRVEVKNPSVQAMVTTKLEHFEGRNGVRGEISASLVIEISLNKTDSRQNKLVITLSVALEQEVVLGMSISSETTWGKKWIFPYIKEIEVTAAISAGTFTGFGIYAQVQTQSESLNENTPWSQLLDVSNKGLDMNDDTVKKVSTTLTTLGSKMGDLQKNLKLIGGYGVSKDKGEASEIGGTDSNSPGAGGGLMEKYSGMLSNDAEYIRLVDKNIVNLEGSPDPLHIICFGLRVNLVVKMKVNALVGFTVSYGNAKQYAYTFKIFEQETNRAEADLETPNFRMDFFAFGMIGFRAGVVLDLRVGLISTSIDSIGVQIEIGAYLEVYGFFYVALAWESGKDFETEMFGSLLLDVGLYLDVNFYAQLGNGRLGTTKPLYNVKWSIFSVGTKVFPMDFEIEEGDSKLTLTVGKDGTAVIPKELLKVKGMQVDTGKEAIVDIKASDLIATSATNTVSINTKTGAIVFTPNREDKNKGSCTAKVTLTYDNKTFGINSNTISREVTLNWQSAVHEIKLIEENSGKLLYTFECVDEQIPGSHTIINDLLRATKKEFPGYEADMVYFDRDHLDRRTGKERYEWRSFFALTTNKYYKDETIKVRLKDRNYYVNCFIDGRIEYRVLLPYGEKFQGLPQFEKEGYYLSAWCDNRKNPVDFSNIIPSEHGDGYAMYANWIPIHDHEWGEEKVTKVATCVQTGTAEKTCAVCGEKEERELPKDATNHSNQHVVKDASEADCAKEGYTGDECCADCGEVLVKGEVIPLREHTFLEGTVVTAATCTKEGEKVYICSVCQEEKSEVLPKDPNAHETQLANVVEMTCTKDGYTGDEVCVHCGNMVTRGQVIPKQHKLSDRTSEHKASYSFDEYGGVQNFKAPYSESECSICHEKFKNVHKVTPVIYGTNAYYSQILEFNAEYYHSIQDLENEYLWASFYIGGKEFENRQDIEGTFTFLEDYSKYTLDYIQKNKKDVTLKVRFTPEDTENFNTVDFTVTFKYGKLPMSEEGVGDPIGAIVAY